MKTTILTLMGALFVVMAAAQSTPQSTQTTQDTLKFTDTKVVPVTSVKNQASSGTCWSFSGLAFLESEIIIAGGPELDLSPMFVVRHAYYDRAVKYVRMHGTSGLGAGAASEDVFICWRKHGIVPTEVYTGLSYGEDIHRHNELDAVIKGYCDAVIKNPNRKLTTAWLEGLDAILDAYLGKLPEKFTYRGHEFTPRSFADSLPVDIDDYISLTSYTHHPFHTSFILEVPDNTVWGTAFNVPLAEMMEAIEGAIVHGHPVLWASDVSEKGFEWKRGVASIADTTAITQKMRQDAFDNWETTDDHGMVIIGTAIDQHGAKYFKVKNSWGIENHIYGGFFYASYPFVAYKTMSVIVNKKTLPWKLGTLFE